MIRRSSLPFRLASLLCTLALLMSSSGLGFAGALGGQNTPVVTYTYGTSGLTNGAVLSVTDNLSGVSQAMSYVTSGAAIGGVAGVTETNGSDVYSSSYTYTSTGDRFTSTYVTQAAVGLSNTTRWRYADYVNLGDPAKQSRVFQTLTSLDNNGNPTPEEFHYTYDTAGRVREATFAQTPQAWTPGTGGNYYDQTHNAATRGRAHYEYDSGGRLARIMHWWDTLQGNGTYSSGFIRGNECDYELTGINRGLKTASRFLIPVNGQPTNWQTQRQETYGYDASLDYLTSANYGDGLANATPSWTYDAAGNRASDSSNTGTWSYDNLNRMTASPGLSATDCRGWLICAAREAGTVSTVQVSATPLASRVSITMRLCGFSIINNLTVPVKVNSFAPS